MGCGLSRMEAEDVPESRRYKRVHEHVIIPPVAENKPLMKKDDDTSNGERLKEKCVVNMKEKVEHNGSDEKHENNVMKNNEEENEYRDDSFIGPGSPSFREYCRDYDSVDQSSVGDSNDCDSRESIKNGSDDDSTNRPRNETSVNYNKEEPEKKDRKGRGFRNAINNRRTRRKRNLLSFACYNSSSHSYAEGSMNKIPGKNA